ncbi:chemotaxis protein CheB [Lederbergia citrea]|uniref:protein-glutamate methylesterase n=1 Tax=Lederbergia citrea TaxID=2833581 RepID=A0A942UHN7_9BACI|nr:chemotaxis protein CheB [Lederbergia citrea]MBS4203765.1 chemotaxis protein CheB [Lederbergia citrea]MBS4221650.1 chemotaxis protein CheB [Lederbergia citrea]
MTLRNHRQQEKIICIGTSTGGPRALQVVLSKLPSGLQAPIVIVQHMPPNFTKSLANRLNSICDINVKEAEDGEILKKGTAYLAPGGKHMEVLQTGREAVVKIIDTLPVNGHRPSVDVLFESISHFKKYEKIAVIMTGMGNDGAAGLIKLKESGNAKAIAESESSCIVYGMPKAAINTDMVDEIEDLENIAATILTYMN